jgi:exopolysaccharide production protein ExoZ
MRSQFDSLQALRGVACLLVWGVHLASWEAYFGMARPPLAPLLRFGFAGVDLFFVLSGFIITHTQGEHVGRPAAVTGYLFRRFWRVYPVYWMMFGLALALGVWGFGTVYGGPDGSPAPWLAWLALWPHDTANGVLLCAWTLCYEVLFYAAFAVVLLLPRGWGAALLAAWGLAVAWAMVWGEGIQSALGRHVFSPMIWEFLLGCGIAWAVRRGWNRFGWTAALAGVAWGTVGVLLVSSKAEPFTWAGNVPLRVAIFGPAAGLVVYGLAAAELRTGRTLPRWLRWVGDGSYSVYLWHLPVGWAMFHWTTWWSHTNLGHWAWLGLMTAVGVGGGMAFHWIVERPIVGLLKGRKRPAVVAGEVTAERVEVATRPASEAAVVSRAA